jgi:hypothetical protein
MDPDRLADSDSSREKMKGMIVATNAFAGTAFNRQSAAPR